MSELLPQFKSFYASLTDQQKRALAPRGRMKMQGMQMQHPGRAMPKSPAAPATPGLDG